MIFHPLNVKRSEGYLLISAHQLATAHPCLNKPVLKEFWKNFTFGQSELFLSETDELCFSVGNAPMLALDGMDYAMNIEREGISLCAKNEQALLWGFMTLLDHLCARDIAGEMKIVADFCQIQDRASIQNRMVHFCIFPETELWDLRRFIRFCGALKYTHVVLEFWGMLKYDCMKELAWSNAFTKEELRPIIDEARDMGLEIIPMFNHWGHASSGRVVHGKHVVLDQNPTHQTYFSEDGWCWDIRAPKVRTLLRQVREELMELCGEGSYFHIGCDEAYNFDLTQEDSMQTICDYVNEIAEELGKEGRKTVLWGDMFLYKYPHYNPNNRYACNAPMPECEQRMLERLNKNVIIADWQYNAKEAPVETSAVFTRAGFSCLLCPWDQGAPELSACLSTVKDQGLFGILHTTWHTLSTGMPYVLMAALGSMEENYTVNKTVARTRTAALWRKVMPTCGEYGKAGWSQKQIAFKW